MAGRARKPPSDADAAGDLVDFADRCALFPGESMGRPETDVEEERWHGSFAHRLALRSCSEWWRSRILCPEVLGEC